MEFYNRKVAISASALLALIPVFVAHGQIAAIDTPVALFFTTTILFFMLALKQEKKSYFIASMISLGLLIDTKFNGLFAIPVILLAYLVYQLKYPQINFKLKKMFNDGQKRTGVIGQIDSFFPVIPFICMGIVSLITMYVIWPYLWTNPLNIRNSFDHWSSYVPAEYLLGNLYQPVPSTYYVIYFIVTTPLLLFIPMTSGVIEALKRKNPFKLIVLFWFVIPFLYSFSPFKQDNMRYLLMIYPPLALICADGIFAIAGWINSWWPEKLPAGTTFYVITGSLLLYLLVILASFHPYYLDYYNVVGGSSKDIYEKKLFEFGWWGEGIYDSVMYVERSAYPNSNVYMGTLPYDVVYFYGKNMNYIRPSGNLTVPYNTDYIITNVQAERYWDIHFNQSDFRLVYETDVCGAPLAKVYKRISG
jgi:dolichyl-phosphate-mannose--protein O-mannosyl transferase